MICVSVSSYKQLGKVVEKGPPLVELRFDLIREDPGRLFLIIPDPVRTIVTCRPQGFSDDERIALFRKCMDLGAAYVDVEIESDPAFLAEVGKLARDTGTEMIVSYHNFDGTPEREELQGIMLSCYEKGGIVAKVASRVNTGQDVRNLLSLYDLPGRKVVLGMGKEGRITRLVAPYMGAEFTFASPEEGGETAPGQFSLEQLKMLYQMIDQG